MIRSRFPASERNRTWGPAERMRWLWISTLALVIGLAGPTVTAATVESGSSLPEVYVEVLLDPEQTRIHGTMRLHSPPPTVEFSLLPGLRLTAARADDKPLSWRQSGSRYNLNASEAATLFLEWEGHPEIAQGRVLFGADGGFLPGRSGWYPHPQLLGDFRAELTLRTPRGQRAVGTGSRLVGGAITPDEIDAAHLQVASFVHPRIDQLEVATGPWREQSRTVSGVLLTTLFPAELSERLSTTYLDHLEEFLPLFVERAGPYPFSSFTVAASPLPVGLAFPGWTLMGEAVLPLPFIPRSSLAHEFLHSWWGTGVRVDYGSGNWSEGLTTYMADYFLDEQRGLAQATRERWLLDLAWLPAAQDHPLRDFRSGNQGSGRMIGYNRAALVFHMLRNRIGDEAFYAATRQLNERFRYRVAGWDDLAAIFSETSGQDLERFFWHWLEREGMPEIGWTDLSIAHDSDQDTLVGRIFQTPGVEPWPVEIPLILHTEDGTVRYVIDLDQGEAEIRIPLSSTLLAVDLDSSYEVLRAWPDPPPIARTVTLDPSARFLATQPEFEWMVEQIFRGGRASPLPSEDHFTTDVPTLLIGETREIDELKGRLGLNPPLLSFQTEGSARMWTVPNTRTLVISADDTASLGRITRSLRHQGHRSYLIQDDRGRTIATGVWDSRHTVLRWAPENY